LQEELNLKLNPSFIFNDLSSLKAAILSNLGFGLIPYYVVQEELKNKTLYDYEINLKSPMSFGVWWRHDFKNKELINSLIDFLKKVEI
jgi:DNA-binding transcriptional LysR family regulator